MANSNPNGPIVIKKYGNRRLYDTDQSRYLTLEELSHRIRAGNNVRVTDAKTGADLTQAVLSQIILEQPRTARLLPIPLLTQLIRLDDDAFAEFASIYLSAALDLYQQAKRNVRSLAALNPVAEMPLDVTNALARMLVGLGAPLGWTGTSSGPGSGFVHRTDPPPSEEATAGVRRTDGVATEIAVLRREIENLKSSLAAEDGGSSKTEPKPRTAGEKAAGSARPARKNAKK